jgi:hypothetical protein
MERVLLIKEECGSDLPGGKRLGSSHLFCLARRDRERLKKFCHP